jgi:glucose/arabinose dehydrogenase
MMNRIIPIIGRMMCGLVLLGGGCFGQQGPTSQGRDVSKLYADHCLSCHGVEMRGGSASSLADSVWRYGGDDASLTKSIRDGHPEAGMPATRGLLNDAEIRGLVILIREYGAAFEREHTKFNKPQVDEVVRSEKAAFVLQAVLADGLSEPWALAFLPDGRMLVTERPGRLRIVDHGRLLPEPVRGVPAVFGGEGGLLDVKLHPQYARTGHDWIYLSYGDKSPEGFGMAAVIRGHLRDGAFVDQQQVFKADYSMYRVGGQRFGSRLLFDKKGYLYFSLGDRGHPGDEQDLAHPNGKVHRVRDDGRIPMDNPFAKRAGAMGSIWTYGHRNPQGLVFSAVTGALWEAEHGPRGGDELNILRPGHNYGWPIDTYGMNYDATPITDHPGQAGMEKPVTYWLPSIAASAITFYTGDRFPEWKNNLFVGALGQQELRRLVVEGETVKSQEILFKGIGRVRNLLNGPDGYLYVVMNEPARILRVAPADGK